MMQSSTLYSVSLVLLSAGCLSVFLTACLAWWKIRGLKGTPSVSFSPTSVTVTGSSFLPASTVNKLGGMVLVLTAFSLALNLWMIVGRYGRSERITLKNVHVLAQTSPDTFTMEVQAKPGEWHSFMAHFCEDSQLTPEIRPGVTLLLMVYSEDRHQHCFDVRQPNGYVLWRDDRNVPILSNFAQSGSPAPPCAAETAGPEQTARSERSRQGR